ncbi:hypothetical protein COOONC_06425 [Cooperia oncophora]
MNTFPLVLILCVAVVGVWGAIREKRQQRTVIQRTVINNYGGQGFNRVPPPPPYGFNRGVGWNNGWGAPAPLNRGPFGPAQPTSVIRTTVIRQG